MERKETQQAPLSREEQERKEFWAQQARLVRKQKARAYSWVRGGK